MKTWWYDLYCFSMGKYYINKNKISYEEVLSKFDRIIYKLDKGFKFDRETPKNDTRYWKEEKKKIIEHFKGE